MLPKLLQRFCRRTAQADTPIPQAPTDKHTIHLSQAQTSMQHAYHLAMQIGYDCLRRDKEQSTHSLELLIQSVKIDLWGSSLTRILFEERDCSEALYGHDWLPKFPFPKTYHPARILEMPFGDHVVIAMPYDKGKWKNALHDLSVEEFAQHKNPLHNYVGNYYPELGLICIYNGRHHAAAATLRAQGSADVNVYPLSLCFPHFWTDGAFWCDKRTGQGDDVHDVRMAILYGLVQMRWREQNQMP